MLLNEFLKEHKAFVQEQRKVQELEKQVEKLAAGLQKVSAEIELKNTCGANGSQSEVVARNYKTRRILLSAASVKASTDR